MLRKISIVFGTNCNFNCKYCYEKNMIKENYEFNPNLLKYIEKEAEKGEPFYLMYIGGEPLLYMDKIKIFIDKFSNNPNIIQLMDTNGSLLTEEYVELFNKNKVTIIIAYDPMHSENYDILKDANLIRLINKLEYKEFIIVNPLKHGFIEYVNKILNKIDIDKNDITYSPFQITGDAVNEFNTEEKLDRMIKNDIDNMNAQFFKKLAPTEILDSKPVDSNGINRSKGLHLCLNGYNINPVTHVPYAYIDENGNRIKLEENYKNDRKNIYCKLEECEYYDICSLKKFQITESSKCKYMNKKRLEIFQNKI